MRADSKVDSDYLVHVAKLCALRLRGFDGGDISNWRKPSRKKNNINTVFQRIFPFPSLRLAGQSDAEKKRALAVRRQNLNVPLAYSLLTTAPIFVILKPVPERSDSSGASSASAKLRAVLGASRTREAMR